MASADGRYPAGMRFAPQDVAFVADPYPVYEEPWKVQVGMLAGVSVVEE